MKCTPIFPQRLYSIEVLLLARYLTFVVGEAWLPEVESARSAGEGWKVPPIPAEALNVNPDDREWVNRQCIMQPLATFQQRIHFTGAIDRIRNVTFILANGWSPSPFPPFYNLAKARGWNTLTVPCGHDVMLDCPEELTAQLLAVCSRKVVSA